MRNLFSRTGRPIARPAGQPHALNQGRQGDGIITPINAVPALFDPSKPRIDYKPADLLNPAPVPTIADRKLYDFVVTETWKKCRNRRIRNERDWKLCVEFDRSNQWLGWDNKARKFINLTADDPDPRRFSTTNLIHPRIVTVGSMVTQTAPDSQPVPMTLQNPLDKEAAIEARGVIGNYNRKFGGTQQVRAMADSALVSCMSFLKSTFDPTAVVMTPVYGKGMISPPPPLTQPQGLGGPAQGAPQPPPAPQREIVGVKAEAWGDIDERVIPSFRVYGDYAGLRFEDWRFLIHCELYPLSWYHAQFENGQDVDPDAGGGVVSYDNNVTAVGISTMIGIGLTGGWDVGNYTDLNSATCYEMWILPGKLDTFPLGALITCAGDVVLRPNKEHLHRVWGPHGYGPESEDAQAGRKYKPIPGNYQPWPYECTTEFPFIPLQWDSDPDSPYGRSLVQDLIEPQTDYNRTRTRLREILERSKPVIAVPMMAKKGADKLVDMGVYSEFAYDGTSGRPPTLMPLTFDIGQYVEILKIIEENMDDIAGIHDPNFRGSVPNGVTSGVAIEGLRRGDASRLSKFAGNIERFVEGRDTWRLRHVSQYMGEDRLMEMDDTGNPNEAAANVISFKAMTGGGQVRIKVTPGSALSETPDAKNARIKDLYGEEMFGPVSSPVAVSVAAKLMEGNDANIILDAVPALIAQAQAELDAKAGPPQPPPPDPMQLAQMNAQIQMQLEQAKHQGELAKIQAQSQADLAKIQAQTDATIRLEQAKRAMPPTVTIAGKLTPGGEAAAEEAAGLDIHGAGSHIATVADANPLHAQAAYGTPPPAPDPSEQAALEMQQAEHGAGLEVQKNAATQAMTPPEPPEAPEPQPDTEGDHERAKDMETHKTDEAIRLAEAQAKLAPTGSDK